MNSLFLFLNFPFCRFLEHCGYLDSPPPPPFASRKNCLCNVCMIIWFVVSFFFMTKKMVAQSFLFAGHSHALVSRLSRHQRWAGVVESGGVHLFWPTEKSRPKRWKYFGTSANKMTIQICVLSEIYKLFSRSLVVIERYLLTKMSSIVCIRRKASL